MISDPKDSDRAEQEAPPDSPKKVLSAEEQMEQFEEDLKENDWGHQPC